MYRIEQIKKGNTLKLDVIFIFTYNWRKLSINCDKITKETKSLMFSLIDKTENENREHLIKLCEDKNRDITHSDICIGSYCEVEIENIECPKNTKEIGDFHTHIASRRRNLEIGPSYHDIVRSAILDMSLCIGTLNPYRDLKLELIW